MNYEILYFADPMCSWCYGFSSVIRRIEDEYKSKIKFNVILGGLNPFEEIYIRPSTIEDVKHHWHAVEQTTGKQFNFSFFDTHKPFKYDTAPASKAVVAVNEMAPERALEFLGLIQQAFYSESEDPTDFKTYEYVLDKMGLSKETFKEIYNRENTEESMLNCFRLSKQLGIMGFPSVLFKKDNDYILLSHGYIGYEEIKRRIDSLMSA